MTPGFSIERLAVLVVTILVGGAYLYAGLASRRCSAIDQRRLGATHSAVVAVACAVASLDVLRLLAPAIAYAILCLSMVTAYLIGALQAERARRRRVASLSPRPRAEVVPTIWIVVVVLSTVLLVPFIAAQSSRPAALLIGACALLMAGIAWRLASAPLQLSGPNPQDRWIEERADRATRSGITSVIAVGIVFVFVCFTGATFDTAWPPERHLVDLSGLVLWAGLWLWETLYVRAIWSSHP